MTYKQRRWRRRTIRNVIHFSIGLLMILGSISFVILLGYLGNQ